MSMTRDSRRALPAAVFCSMDPLESRRHLDASAPWGSSMRTVGLDALRTNLPGVTGSGQTVAIVDTGIDYTHPSLGGGIGFDKKVLGGYDFVDDDLDPMDTNGHGTAVAGVVASGEFERFGFRYQGIAPDARLVALRIGADTSSVQLDRIEAALQWILANAETYRIGVVNLSFGFGTFEDPHAEDILSDELSMLADRDIVFVASSGNNGLSGGEGITYPGADPNAISVGSVNANDVISEFTQRSSNLDLLAVGESVYAPQRGGGYGSFVGTSFAAPAVAGAVALARSVDPTFTLGDVQSILRASSIANVDGDQETGQTTGYTYKRLDVERLGRIALQRRAGPSEQQESIGEHGMFNRVAYDSLGVAHLVYYDTAVGTMKYATRSTAGTWSTVSTIDTSSPRSGSEFSLVVDSAGRPRLAYLDGPNGDLKFARFDDGTWSLETIDHKGVTGLYPSLTIADDDELFVSYFRKTNFDLRVMSFNPNDEIGWRRETIDTEGSVGWSSNIQIDRNGQLAVAYGDETLKRLKLARQRSNGSWAFETVDANVKGAAYLSLAFNASNRPRISYYEVQSSDLKFAAENATSGGSAWSVSRIASKGATGLYTNLRIDDDDQATIIYWDRRTNSIQRAAGKADGSSRWSLSRVADNGGRYVSATCNRLNDRWTFTASGDDKLIFSML